MAPRLPSRRTPPIGFAHRGAAAHAPENTMEAFQLALRLGATGLGSDVWLTADGKAVLHHEGSVGGRLRRKAIASLRADELPPEVPRLTAVYEACGTGFELSLDVTDPAAAVEAIAVARDAGVEDRLWLCHTDGEVAAEWRELSPAVHLVESTKLNRMKEGPERRAATLARAGISAVKLPQGDWTGGHITLFHRFELDCLGWGAPFRRTMDELLDAGIDGVFSEHVDELMAAIDALGG